MADLCKQGYEVTVLESYAGYYIGTHDEEGFPNCRLSQQYYKTKDEAEEALEGRTFTERNCVENNFCNGGHGRCFKE